MVIHRYVEDVFTLLWGLLFSELGASFGLGLHSC